MNPFLMLSALLMLGGFGWEGLHHDWRQAVVYLAFAVANALLGLR